MSRVALATLWHGRDLPDYSGGVYDTRYVKALAAGLRRSANAELAILLDSFYYDVLRRPAAPEVLERAELTKVTPLQFHGYGVGGWSNVLEMFRPDLWPDFGERRVAFGLDTVLVGNCEWLWEWDHGPVALPMDPYETHTVCDAVISWDREGAEIVWEEFLRSRVDGMQRHLYGGRPSEMVLLRDLWKRYGWTTFDQVVPGELLSYKAHVRDGAAAIDTLDGWNGLHACQVSTDRGPASVIYFHGSPKPADLPKDDPIRRTWAH